MSIEIQVETRRAEIKLFEIAELTPELTPKAVKLATRLIFDEMKRIVPVKTGKLKSSILQFADGENGVVSTNSGYGKFVDEDTKAHTIRARYVDYLRIPVADGFIFRKQVFHPGTTGQHFTQKSVQNAKPEIIVSLNDMLREEIR